MVNGDDLIAETLKQAQILEGTIRNTGTHACGVIITPEPLMGLIPITRAKDSDLMVTQFDNSVVEDAGLLKMDFLGLRNLTIDKAPIIPSDNAILPDITLVITNVIIGSSVRVAV